MARSHPSVCCKQVVGNRISVSSLYYWRKKLAPTPNSVKVECAATNGFIELGDVPQSFGSWDIELELGEMVLRVRQA